ncbi:MAG: formylglycine-generating enzyme family protein [Planctomycetota bacterium]|jgi:formylglycine-generating enzyme required for sulfatase activity
MRFLIYTILGLAVFSWSAPETANGQDFPIENSIGMKFAKIPKGKSEIGTEEKDGDIAFNPCREIEIQTDFYLSIYEVRLSDYLKVTGQNPFKLVNTQEENPVLWVSWDDCQIFCNSLSSLDAEKAEGRTYRLPTEAEWEYACRAGSKTAFCFGNDVRELGRYAWTKNNTTKVNPVGGLKPNAFGLFDMHGNAWEWCQDDYFYRNSLAEAKHGTFIPKTSRKVVRGGGWDSPSNTASSSYRFFRDRENKDNYTGFRVVLEVKLKD